MAGEPLITIVGNISEPELRFTPAGKPVCSFGLASTPRVKDGDGWKDGEPTWFQCTAWEQMAENVAESLERGTRVIAQGYLSTRTYEARDGGERKSLEFRIEAIGPDLRWASAKVTKALRGQGGGQSQPQGQRGQVSRSAGQTQDDPWASPSWGTPAQNDEPPF